jgi:hypothetical protein
VYLSYERFILRPLPDAKVSCTGPRARMGFCANSDLTRTVEADGQASIGSDEPAELVPGAHDASESSRKRLVAGHHSVDCIAAGDIVSTSLSDITICSLGELEVIE